MSLRLTQSVSSWSSNPPGFLMRTLPPTRLWWWNLQPARLWKVPTTPRLIPLPTAIYSTILERYRRLFTPIADGQPFLPKLDGVFRLSVPPMLIISMGRFPAPGRWQTMRLRQPTRKRPVRSSLNGLPPLILFQSLRYWFTVMAHLPGVPVQRRQWRML